MSVADRFWEKVDKATECWEWRAGTNHHGYGWFKGPDGAVLAHRFAWELINGPIRDGFWVLHHCDNRLCVNPEHLYLGDNQQNVDDKMRRGRHPNSLQTECKHGHPFDEANTYVTKRGARMCRACNRIAQQRYADRKRAA